MEEMDRYAQTIDNSCRRTGKTTTKELWCLEYLATHGDQEEGIVAPREAQSQVNLGYHLDAIRRSAILDAYLMYDRGRKQFADRSEEHTSELQSLMRISYAVFCLKKKKKQY